ncbi:unnamed protein product [Citrullus colocynthis]|uniref:Uncharacterized protein n=1 Tax=Citrullus colocynthis TaxID=252529 RepID=A0ABP0YT66_9ROSI
MIFHVFPHPLVSRLIGIEPFKIQAFSFSVVIFLLPHSRSCYSTLFAYYSKGKYDRLPASAQVPYREVRIPVQVQSQLRSSNHRSFSWVSDPSVSDRKLNRRILFGRKSTFDVLKLVGSSSTSVLSAWL